MKQAFIKPNVDQVQSLLRSMVGRHVVVVGDVMLDHYLTGRIDRISPEAPVPVFEIQREQIMLGGAANVAKCLVALGARVSLCGLIGEDDNARALTDEAANIGIDTFGLIRDPDRPTTLKTRVVSQGQQMIRLDREAPGSIGQANERRLVERLREVLDSADAVVLSDYSKGVLTSAVCRTVIDGSVPPRDASADGLSVGADPSSRATARQRAPVVVDPKDLPWERYRGATLIKPNRREASHFHQSEIIDDATAGDAASAMLRELQVAHALITRGEQGMTLGSQTSQGEAVPQPTAQAPTAQGGASAAASRDAAAPSIVHLPPIHRDVFDPTGAGDIVATVLALALAAEADAATAGYLANIAAAVEVSKFGTAAVSDSEILEALGASVGGPAAYERKVLTREQAARLADNLHREGARVVFTNGCFDLLHVGHVNYLERSARLGDALIVGVNTDASVRRLKGMGRPVQNERDRAHIIAAQACVEGVVLFDEDTPLELIREVKPDVLTKGADYGRRERVVGWDVVESYGGRVALIDLIEGRSTSEILEKAKT